MSYSSSTLYNGLFIVNGNVLMGNNTPITSPSTYPSGSTPLICSGDDTFNGNGSRYMAATNLALQAQSITDPGGKAWGSKILLEGAKEGLGGLPRSNGAIQFITGGSEKLRVNDNGLYIFSGNIPVRLQTYYNSVSPFDCTFEINANYDKLTNLVDGAPYGTASLQVNANQAGGGYISMATGAKNTVPTEVVRVTGNQMNVLSISTGSLSVGSNITLGGILTGNGSGLTNLPGLFSSSPNIASLIYVSPNTSQNTTNSIWGGFSGSNPRIYVNINNIMATYTTTKYLVASGDIYTLMLFRGGGNTNRFTQAPDNGGLPYFGLAVDLTNSSGTRSYTIFIQTFSTDLNGNFGASTNGTAASVGGTFNGPVGSEFPGILSVQDTKKNNSIDSQIFTMAVFGAYTVSFRVLINMQMQSGDNGANYTASMSLPTNGPIRIVYE